ncbi:MAG: DedA family protein [bacterium]|nr:DedA family protein [bacterium]
MGLTQFIAEHATNLIHQGGYFMVAFLMALESMIAPVPSEAVMPFAGFLIYEGKFTFPLTIFFSTLGSIIGSLLSYVMGVYGGKPLILRYGKYLLLDKHDLEATEKFFGKYGDKTIFVSRFIPVIRHLISIPAGIGKMNLTKFCIYTVLGAALWNGFLAWVGFKLRNNWDEVMKYSHVVDIVVVGSMALVVGYFVYKHVKGRKN